MALDLGGGGPVVGGQLTLFKTFKQLSHVENVSPKLMSLRVPKWNCYSPKWEHCVGFLYILFSNALITQDFTPPQSALSQDCLHTPHATCFTLRHTVNTAHTQLGKIMRAWCAIQGTLAYFSVKEKYFSRIILVALMRTQDEVEHSGSCTVMALSSRTCRTSSLPFDTLRWNKSMIEEDTFTINYENVFSEVSLERILEFLSQVHLKVF